MQKIVDFIKEGKMKNYKKKISKLKKKYNLDYLKLYTCEDILGDLAPYNFLCLIIGKNNRYFNRDMKYRVITDKVFDGLMKMIPEMINKLNEILPEDIK